jgi:hypothetical protein
MAPPSGQALIATLAELTDSRIGQLANTRIRHAPDASARRVPYTVGKC